MELHGSGYGNYYMGVFLHFAFQYWLIGQKVKKNKCMFMTCHVCVVVNYYEVKQSRYRPRVAQRVPGS